MPYSNANQLPTPIRVHLPPHAQRIYKSAFNHAYSNQLSKTSPHKAEIISHKIAWSAVKKNYAKQPTGQRKNKDSSSNSQSN